jgi:hypothetical protein
MLSNDTLLEGLPMEEQRWLAELGSASRARYTVPSPYNLAGLVDYAYEAFRPKHVDENMDAYFVEEPNRIEQATILFLTIGDNMGQVLDQVVVWWKGTPKYTDDTPYLPNLAVPYAGSTALAYAPKKVEIEIDAYEVYVTAPVVGSVGYLLDQAAKVVEIAQDGYDEYACQRFLRGPSEFTGDGLAIYRHYKCERFLPWYIAVVAETSGAMSRFDPRKMAALLGYLVYSYAQYKIGRVLYPYLRPYIVDFLEASGVRHAFHCWLAANTEQLDTGLRCEMVHNFDPLEFASISSNHSHPNAARMRDQGFRSLAAWVFAAGRDVFSASGSTSRQTNPGLHGWHFPKDLGVAPSFRPVGQNDVICCVDDDYYHNMPRLLRKGNPLVLFTFAPRALAGSFPDGGYYVNPDSSVTVEIAGGARYQHELWDWTHDCITVRDWAGISVVNYAVEYRRVKTKFDEPEADWLYVFLFPIARTSGLASFFVPTQPLCRRKFEVRDDYMVSHFSVVDPKTAERRAYVSLKYTGNDMFRRAAVTLTTNALASLLCKVEKEKIKASYTILSFLSELDVKTFGDEKKFTAAALLSKYLSDVQKLTLPNIVEDSRIVGRKAKSAILIGCHANDDNHAPWKTVARTIHRALTTEPAMAPATHPNNANASHVKRVEMVLNTKRPPNEYQKWAQQYVSRLASGYDHSIYPLAISEVMERQQGSLQIRRNADAAPWIGDELGEPKLKTFMKQEAVNNFGDPRNITTVTTDFGLVLSSYTYAVKEAILKKLPWYAPGKTLEQCAYRLLEMASHQDYLTEADGSRFDGRVSEWLMNNIQRAFYVRVAAFSHKQKVIDLLSDEQARKATDPFGAQYLTGSSRLSGSPLTTDGNTIITAYIDYCAGRLSGLDEEEAWLSLGIYSGDDIVSRQRGSKVAEAAAALGMVHDCIEHRDATAVGFLGRHFFGLFGGSPVSLQDQPRTWGKIHLTFSASTIPIVEAMYNKAFGYLVLDPGNPLTVSWARMVMRVAEPLLPARKRVRRITRWDVPFWFWDAWERYVLEKGLGDHENPAAELINPDHIEDFVQDFEGWPQPATPEDALHLAARDLGTDVPHLEALIRKMDAVATMEELEKLGLDENGAEEPFFKLPHEPHKNAVVIVRPSAEQHGVPSEFFDHGKVVAALAAQKPPGDRNARKVDATVLPKRNQKRAAAYRQTIGSQPIKKKVGGAQRATKK